MEQNMTRNYYIKVSGNIDNEAITLLWRSGFKKPALFVGKNIYNKVLKISKSLFVEKEYVNIRRFFDALEISGIFNAKENKHILFPSQEIHKKRVYIVKDDVDRNLIEEISKDLKDYQKELLVLALALKRSVIVLDTGLGKTLIGLKFLEYLSKKGKNKFLILVPKKALVKVWDQEKQKWNIDIKVEIQTIQKLLRDIKKKVARGTYKEIEKIVESYDAIIIDEAHEIVAYNNRPKASYKVAKALASKSEYLLMLTATPVVNSPSDLYGYLSLIGFNIREVKEILGKWKMSSILREALVNISKQMFVYKPIDKLKLLGISVNKNDIVVNFYKKEFENNFIRMVDNFYKYLETSNLRENKIDNRKELIKLFSIFSKYISESLVYWNGFRANGKYLVVKHPKVQKLKELLDKHSNEKVLVIGYHKNIELLKSIIEGRDVFIFNGEKKENLDEYKQTQNGVLLLSIRAGGLGINLENVDIAIFYEYWWTWVSYKQVLDRIIRLTSTNNKTIYNLISIPEVNLSNIPNYLYWFAKSLIDKGYHSLDLWMVRKISEKKEDLESLLRGNESIVYSLFKDIMEAYEFSKRNKQ